MTSAKLNNGCAIALGNFDGLHIGHMAVLEKTLEEAENGLRAAVMLFDEHSMKGITGEAPPMLITEDERIELLKNKGIDVFTVSFSQIKELSPEDFVEEILIRRFNARTVVCGFNYRFGNKAKGDAKLLEKICIEKNLKCVIIDEVEIDGLPVNSTAIRRAVEKGEIKLANKMLDRKFGYRCEVIDGDKRGRTWGFPTANQKLPEALVTPAFGVYESSVTVDGAEYRGVTNIGLRPTVGDEKVLSETHILGYEGDLYGRCIDIRLVRFIRQEQKFSSFDELICQIQSDVLSVKGGV